MGDSINDLVDDLKSGGLTVRMLQTLDLVVPGGWNNITDFDEMIRNTTGEDDSDYIRDIRNRAIELYDEEKNYQRAMRVYKLVDDIDKVAGMAAMANQLSGKFKMLQFMDRFTPKDETTQALDAAAKLAAELTTFCLINGIPGDSVSDFARSLAAYGKEDALRIAAWIAIEGFIPLGPNFMDMVADRLDNTGESELKKHKLFAKVSKYMPGDSIIDSKGLVMTTIGNVRETVGEFSTKWGFTRENLVAKMRGFVDITDDRLDYLGAGLDMVTSYYEHTGTQTLARQIIDRAYAEV